MKLLDKPLYPFIFGIFIVASWVVFNPSEIQPIELIRPIILVEAMLGLVMFALFIKVGNYHKAGDLSLLFLVFLFYFGYFSRIVEQNIDPELLRFAPLIALAIWIIIFLLVGLPVYIRRKSAARRIGFTRFLNIGTLILLILPILLLWDGYRTRITWEFQPSRITVPEHQIPGDRPDIYYILLDGFGRADVLSAIYDFDNSDFISDLENMGFEVAVDSRANYMMTMQSLSSTLNMSYLPDLGLPSTDKETRDRVPLEKLVHQSALRLFLEDIGYRFIAIDSGFAHTEIVDADVYLSEKAHLSKHEELLLSMTPLSVIEQYIDLRLPIHGYHTHQQAILSGFDQIEAAVSEEGPKFVFVHIMAPHPPFVFDRVGAPLTPAEPYSLRDGDNFPGSREEYIEGYRNQLAFIVSELTSALEIVLEHSSSEPVVVLQGDHGPGSLYSFHFTERSCFWERAGILNAYYLPGSPSHAIYPSISPVNSFRVILNTYFGTDLNLLEDASYNITWSKPYEYIPIADFDEAQCGEKIPGSGRTGS